MVSAVIVAAGRGTRMGADKNKVFLELSGKSVITYTINAFLKSDVSEIIIVTSAECMDDLKAVLPDSDKPIKIVLGGATRQESVLNGISAASGEIVCIHDGARAFVTPEKIGEVIADCKKYGAAAVGVNCKDTMKLVSDDGFIESTVNRDKLYSIQTPQVFCRAELIEAHTRAKAEGVEVTDDCALFELYGKKVYVTLGSYDNIKLTTPEDMAVGEKILKRQGVL